MRIMYDSTTPANIPLTGASMIGCYNTGRYENVIQMVQRFPKLQMVTIDVNGSDPDCRVLDFEPGNVQSHSIAIMWARESVARGNKYPTIYCDRSDYAALRPAFVSAGFVPGKTIWFWVATLDMTWKQFWNTPGVAAVQYQDTGKYDVSVVLDDKWIPATVPAPVPPPTLDILGFHLPKPTPTEVPAVVCWYGDAGFTARQANIPMTLWSALKWS